MLKSSSTRYQKPKKDFKKGLVKDFKIFLKKEKKWEYACEWYAILPGKEKEKNCESGREWHKSFPKDENKAKLSIEENIIKYAKLKLSQMKTNWCFRLEIVKRLFLWMNLRKSFKRFQFQVNFFEG